MSEPPSRGPERDLFRDTWVRYLGELRARGTANPQHVAREAGIARGRWGPGDGGSILVLAQPGQRRHREGSELAQGHTALACPALPLGILLVSLPGDSCSPDRRTG